MEQTLGKRIAGHRKRMALTQDQLAEKLGVTAQAVSKWENDQSCPDISVLPRLADIFGISVDELLGRAPIHQDQVIEDVRQDTQQHTYTAKKHGGIALATFVLLVGTIYLISSLLELGLSLWDAAWPSALLVFGLFTLWPKFSFVSLASALLGGYMLASKLLHLYFLLPGGVILAILILLFGISLIADIFIRKKVPSTHMNFGTDKVKCEFKVDGNEFIYECSFGKNIRRLQLPTLERGRIEVSFGDFTMDLSGVDTLAPGCVIDAGCSFGELKILVPKRFQIVHESSTAFADFNVTGAPSYPSEGSIILKAKVRLGEIKVVYV